MGGGAFAALIAALVAVLLGALTAGPHPQRPCPQSSAVKLRDSDCGVDDSGRVLSRSESRCSCCGASSSAEAEGRRWGAGGVAVLRGTNDKTGNYAVGCLEDGTIVMGRSYGKMHAEQDVIRQAGFRRIIDLYSERDPCQERCAELTRGVNTSWSFRWNPPEVRPQSTLAFRDAMRRLFQLP
jgi:hypothetical protein